MLYAERPDNQQPRHRHVPARLQALPAWKGSCEVSDWYCGTAR
jgi:hypothetical protein